MTIYSDENQIVTGIDGHSQHYVLFENLKDFYYFKSFDSDTWQKVPLQLNELPKTKDFPYQFIQAKERNFLIHNGCGEVYEFKNDSIIRIDNSFKHRNQYYANVFTYKGEIYFWGGYGLFTYKNILTKFNFTTKEWDIIKYSNYDHIPKPRKMALSYVEVDNLYIFGGIGEDYSTTNENSNNHVLSDFWKLNLQTKEWEFVGNMKNPEWLHITPENHGYYHAENIIYFDSKKLVGLNLKKNELNYYGSQRNFELSKNEKYNPKRNEIIYTLTSSDQSRKETKVIVQDFNTYRANRLSVHNLLENKYLFLYVIFTVLTVLGLVLLFKKRISFFLLRFKNVIVLHNGEITYKKKPINNLDKQEKELLTFLFDNIEKPLQVNEIIEFFGNDDELANYATLIKRKDAILNSLKSKLAFILEVDESSIFIIKKNQLDKRVHELKLNEMYFSS